LEDETEVRKKFNHFLYFDLLFRVHLRRMKFVVRRVRYKFVDNGIFTKMMYNMFLMTQNEARYLLEDFFHFSFWKMLLPLLSCEVQLFKENECQVVVGNRIPIK